MTGSGYEVTLNGIKGKLKNVFLKYITMETTDTTVTDLRCVEVADVAEVVLIEEQTQRIQLIRNM